MVTTTTYNPKSEQNPDIAGQTDPWVEVKGEPVLWDATTLGILGVHTDDECENYCRQGVLVSPTASNIERCDACLRFDGDLSAAQFLADKVRGVVRYEAAADPILPGQQLDGGIVVASVHLDDDDPDTTSVLALLLMPTPGMHYRVVECWQHNREVYSSANHENIVPAVADYQQSGGDY